MSTYPTESMLLAAFFTLPVLGISLILSLIMIVAMWKIFVKAGKPGWGCLIPFYREYCLMEISWGNGWLFLLLFVPFVNAVFGIMSLFKLAGAFGKGVAFAFGLWFLSIIFFPILAFGDAEYIGPQ